MVSDGTGSAEVRHLLRKHVLLTSIHGKAQLVTCTECRRTGEDFPQNIVHSTKCRYARLMSHLGEIVVMGSKSSTATTATTQTTGATDDQGNLQRKKAKPHDPVLAALECTS